MKLFQFFRKKYEPLLCHPADILDYFKECLSINAPSADFEIKIGNQIHQIGIRSDYTEQRGFFDTEFYLDNQKFDNLDDFCQKAEIENQLFKNLETIKIIRDLEDGDPRNHNLLEKREIKKG